MPGSPRSAAAGNPKLSHVRHDASIEPSQRRDDNKEYRENEADDHDDSNASRQCAEHALNGLPFFLVRIERDSWANKEAHPRKYLVNAVDILRKNVQDPVRGF